MFMYIDPTLGPPLLEPLLRYQQNSTLAYSMRDLGETGFQNCRTIADPLQGSKYPNIIISFREHQEGVERECSYTQSFSLKVLKQL